jgi:hypothetical protein
MREEIEALFVNEDKISFAYGDIPAIFGFTVGTIPSEIIETERQHFSFTVLTKDILDASIGDLFTLLTDTYEVTYRLSSTPIDESGIATFHADFVSRILL